MLYDTSKRLKLFLSKYWGDITYCMTIPAIIYFYYQISALRLVDSVIAFYLFLIYAVFSIIALIRITILKKRAFRDWIFFAYGIMPMVHLLVFLFPFSNPMLSALYGNALESLTLRLMTRIIGGLNMIRFLIWLHKRYAEKRKAEVLPPIESAVSDAEQGR